jgi:ferric-dicitrate binding protein FerR (iron transport regulator)
MRDDSLLRRGALVAGAAAAVVLAALGWRAISREPEADLDAPPAVADPAADDALVLAADAGVERRRSAGDWAPASVLDELHVTDSIRTGAGATAEIALGRGARVTLAERSEVTVRELTAAALRLGIDRGRIGVDFRPDGTRLLRVEDASGTVSAIGTAGRFGFLALRGGLAVASSEGRMTVESGGKSVAVQEGSETVAWRGAAPLPPRPIPREVVLRVARKLGERRASLCAVLQVDVSAEVTVDGSPVEVAPDGTVAVRREGTRRRDVLVAVRHASGLVDRQVVPCRREGDVSDLEVRWNAR